MTAHPPPVPPEQQSDKAPKSGKANVKQTGATKPPPDDRNADRFGDIKQNTTNQGHQQDR